MDKKEIVLKTLEWLGLDIITEREGYIAGIGQVTDKELDKFLQSIK